MTTVWRDCRRARVGASWACNRLEANEVVRRSLDEAGDQEREAIFDFVQAVHDASTELKRKLMPEQTQH
jgi:hypothetical protein